MSAFVLLIEGFGPVLVEDRSKRPQSDVESDSGALIFPVSS